MEAVGGGIEELCFGGTEEVFSIIKETQGGA